MGTMTFLASGLIAVGVFALFTVLLRLLIRDSFLNDVRRIRAGAFVVLVVIPQFTETIVLK